MRRRGAWSLQCAPLREGGGVDDRAVEGAVAVECGVKVSSEQGEDQIAR